MNVLLWILQALLALQFLAGGAYKLTSFDQLAGNASMAALPQAEWAATNPMTWTVGMGVVAAFIAVGRLKVRPFA